MNQINPVYPWEREDWVDNTHARTVPRTPVKTPHPDPKSEWVGIRSNRRVEVLWARHGSVMVSFSGRGEHLYPLDLFVLVYQPV